MTSLELRKSLQESVTRLRNETARYRELLTASRLLHGHALVHQSIEMQDLLKSWCLGLERHLELTKQYAEALHAPRSACGSGDYGVEPPRKSIV